MISLNVTLKGDATFGQTFRYGLQQSHRNHQFLVEMLAGLEGCLSYFELRTLGRKDGIGWVSIRGGSSHGAHLTEEEGLAWIRGVARALKLKANAWFIHISESGRFDFHILCVNQFDGRKLRKREITLLLHPAARHQTGIINAGRRATGRHTIGCCEADGTVVYPMAPRAPAPKVEPAPHLLPPPAPASPLFPTINETAASEEPTAPAKAASDRAAPENKFFHPAVPVSPWEHPGAGSTTTQAQRDAETKARADAAAEAETKRRKDRAEKLYLLLLEQHRLLLDAAVKFGRILARDRKAAEADAFEKLLKEWHVCCQKFRRDLCTLRKNPHLSKSRREDLDSALTEMEAYATAIQSIANDREAPGRDLLGPDRD